MKTAIAVLALTNVYLVRNLILKDHALRVARTTIVMQARGQIHVLSMN